MKPRSAIKTDLFADELHRKKIDTLGDPLAEIESYIDFAALAAEVDRIAPRPVSPQGGRPPYPTETMVRILVLKRLYNLLAKRARRRCSTASRRSCSRRASSPGAGRSSTRPWCRRPGSTTAGARRP